MDHFLKFGGQGSSNLKETLKAMRLILLLSAFEWIYCSHSLRKEVIKRPSVIANNISCRTVGGQAEFLPISFLGVIKCLNFARNNHPCWNFTLPLNARNYNLHKTTLIKVKTLTELICWRKDLGCNYTKILGFYNK